jgi:hypothetical protein
MVRLVDVLVDEGYVKPSMNPIDAIVGEEKEPRKHREGSEPALTDKSKRKAREIHPLVSK